MPPLCRACTRLCTYLALAARDLARPRPAVRRRRPLGWSAVTPFEIARYTGKWYEIARLDHSFERGLSDSQRDLYPAARRQRRSDQPRPRRRSVAAGRRPRAIHPGPTDRALAQGIFLRPVLTGGYHVVALDQADYRWAMVVGPDRDYLWILARDKALPARSARAAAEPGQSAGYRHRPPALGQPDARTNG